MSSAPDKALRVAVIAGEESGDLLGADLAAALSARLGRQVELIGVGGRNLEEQGLRSLFKADEISLMGLTAVLKDLPRLIRRIGLTASEIVRARPDCLVTIDSPDFTLRVARKVRAADASIPIVHYVSPSVWAWRPGRAAAMRPYVDRVLCLLPFEPSELDRLGGPQGVFVGHRLARHPGVLAAAGAQSAKKPPSQGEPHRLLVLPGSRRGEVRSLIEPFGEAVRLLRERTTALDVLMPTVPHVAPLVEQATRSWAVKPEIVLDEPGKWRAFAMADAALACSGTVTLELALSRVPTVACYKTDMLGKVLTRFISVWSASLPNLIANWPVVPEYFNEFIRPGYLARQIGQLWEDTPTRTAQQAGFEEIAAALRTERPSGELAAEAVLEVIRQSAAGEVRQSAIGSRQSE